MNERTQDILYYTHAVLSIIMIVILAFANFGAVMVIYSTTREYHPESTQILDIDGNYTDLVPEDKDLTLISWNIGYGGLGEEADYYADGGKKVKSYTSNGVESNLSGITAILSSIHPDFAMLQEVDLDSTRSYYTNEMSRIKRGMSDYNVSFAKNILADFIPYPFPPVGKVDSGLMTASKYDVSLATRYSLPSNLTWPQSSVNYKNALLVSRVQIKGSEKDLVLVNLQLESNDKKTIEEQMSMLKKLLMSERNSGNYVIAGGDFHQIFSTVEAPTYDSALWKPDVIDAKDFPDTLGLYMDEDTYTARSLDKPYTSSDKKAFQYYMIDGFIVSDNVTVEDMHAIDLGFKNSDHNPIKLSFTLHDSERDEQERQQELEGIKWNLPSESYYGGEDSSSTTTTQDDNRRSYYNDSQSQQYTPSTPTVPETTPTTPTEPANTGDEGDSEEVTGGGEDTGSGEETGGGSEDTGGSESSGGGEETGGGSEDTGGGSEDTSGGSEEE